MKFDLKHFKAWPLLLTGIVLVMLGVGLAEYDEDPSDARAMILGVGAVLVGSGIARVLYDDFLKKHEKHGDDHHDA